MHKSANQQHGIKTVLMTRHGECTDVGGKKLGLNPNAPVSPEALAVMEKHTSIVMEGLVAGQPGGGRV